MERFREAGFSDRELPTDEQPKLPTKISRTSNKELGDLMTQYGAWREYTEHRLTQVAAQASIYKEEYQYAWDVAYQRSASRGTETAKKRELGADQALNAQRMKLLDEEVLRDMLSARAETYTEAIAVLSREITRRGFTVENNA